MKHIKNNSHSEQFAPFQANRFLFVWGVCFILLGGIDLLTALYYREFSVASYLTGYALGMGMLVLGVAIIAFAAVYRHKGVHRKKSLKHRTAQPRENRVNGSISPGNAV